MRITFDWNWREWEIVDFCHHEFTLEAVRLLPHRTVLRGERFDRVIGLFPQRDRHGLDIHGAALEAWENPPYTGD